MEKKPTPFAKSMPHDFGTKFADMTSRAKWIFVGKLVICIATFGFVFPNVQKS